MRDKTCAAVLPTMGKPFFSSLSTMPTWLRLPQGKPVIHRANISLSLSFTFRIPMQLLDRHANAPSAALDVSKYRSRIFLCQYMHIWVNAMDASSRSDRQQQHRADTAPAESLCYLQPGSFIKKAYRRHA